MTKKIVVFSDGETWEVLNEDILVVEVSDEDWNELESGGKPKHMEDGNYTALQVVELMFEHEETKKLLVESEKVPYEFKYTYTFGDLDPDVQASIKEGKQLLEKLSYTLNQFLNHFHRTSQEERDVLHRANLVAASIYGRAAANVLNSLMTKTRKPDVP